MVVPATGDRVGREVGAEPEAESEAEGGCALDVYALSGHTSICRTWDKADTNT